MKKRTLNRRKFMHHSAAGTIGMALGTSSLSGASPPADDVEVGIIGLDTSHSIAFTKYINQRDNGFKVTTAFTTVSQDIPSSRDRVKGYTEDIQEMGVEVVDTIEQLLQRVDCVLLETVDGRPHLEQARQVFEAGKPVFVDKPVAATFDDVHQLYQSARDKGIKTFSCSGTRFMSKPQAVRNGEIGQPLGANTFSPISYEPSHSDLFWYGIHGVELLFTVLGTGCQRVRRMQSAKYDYAIGEWNDGRMGTFCGIKEGKKGYGGQAFGSEGLMDLGGWEGYDPMIEKILHYFRTWEVPVEPAETLEIYAFMEGAQLSSQQQGGWVTLESVLEKTR